MLDNTTTSPGGTAHVHTRSYTAFGITSANFSGIWPWTVGAGDARFANFGANVIGDPLLRYWNDSAKGDIEPPGGTGGYLAAPNFQHAIAGTERFQRWTNQKNGSGKNLYG